MVEGWTDPGALVTFGLTAEQRFYGSPERRWFRGSEQGS